MPKTSKHPGAAWSEAKGMWFARISVDGTRKHLGYYATAEEASAAYIAARGEKAKRKGKRDDDDRPRKREREPQSVKPGEIAVEVLLDLVPAWIVDDSDPRDKSAPKAYRSPFELPDIDELVRVSRKENVSLFTVCEVSGCVGYMLEAPEREHVLREAIRELKTLGLIDRASDIADLVMSRTRPLSWDSAIAAVSDVGDLI